MHVVLVLRVPPQERLPTSQTIIIVFYISSVTMPQNGFRIVVILSLWAPAWVVVRLDFAETPEVHSCSATPSANWTKLRLDLLS